MDAHGFFKTPQDPGVAAAIGKTVHPTTIEPWSVADYSKYLHTRGLRDAGKVIALTQITRAMERVGFLLPSGADPLPFMGGRYLTQGRASPGQVGGNLWLSEIFGAELIIPGYNAVTVQIAGTDAAGTISLGRTSRPRATIPPTPAPPDQTPPHPAVSDCAIGCVKGVFDVATVMASPPLPHPIASAGSYEEALGMPLFRIVS
jgi:hypothetical protein